MTTRTEAMPHVLLATRSAISQRCIVAVVCLLALGGGCQRPTGDSAHPAGAPNEEWTNPNGSIRWPPDEGFAAKPQAVTIAIGVRLDRYGYPGGTFVSPVGVPAADLSLAPGTLDKPHFVYQVLKPLPALEGKAAPWFGQPGGGVQYDLVQSVEHWIDNGFLEVVTEAMDLDLLAKKLEESGVAADMFSLAGGLPNEAHCIEQWADGKWRTYYSERGRRTGIKTFETEEAACEDLYRTVVK